MKDKDYQIIQAMEDYGGSFVKALALAARMADNKNYEILKNAFINYWIEYQQFCK